MTCLNLKYHKIEIHLNNWPGGLMMISSKSSQYSATGALDWLPTRIIFVDGKDSLSDFARGRDTIRSPILSYRRNTKDFAVSGTKVDRFFLVSTFNKKAFKTLIWRDSKRLVGVNWHSKSTVPSNPQGYLSRGDLAISFGFLVG